VIRAFRWAIAFLTVLPVAPRGRPREGELARAAAFFPLVGAGVGLACWGVDLASTDRLPALVRGLLVVAAGTVLTRALHLDGLADTADGLGSMRDRAGMLEVMRDPHVGAFGAAALVIVILIQAVCIAEIPAATRAEAIMAVAVASRLSMTLAAWMLPYAREKGTGSEFVGRVRLWAALLACAFAASCAWAAGRLDSLVTLGVGVGVGLVVSVLIALRLKGATGDTLGASGEIAQTAALVWAATRTFP
jgi:adenosylcobinamide-GDP ribazoletransferase